jgi:hypothetical protein
MEAIIKNRYINTSFSHSDGQYNYDGHLTVHFRWGDYYPLGRNPLAHKQIDELVQTIKPIIREASIGDSVVNCNWGEWEDVTFQYVKKENIKKIFDLCTEIFGR